MVNILTIWEKLNEWSENLKSFMVNHDQSPIIYGGLFLIGLGIFAIVFSILHKDE